jgi:hypothetical protein
LLADTKKPSPRPDNFALEMSNGSSSQQGQHKNIGIEVALNKGTSGGGADVHGLRGDSAVAIRGGLRLSQA